MASNAIRQLVVFLGEAYRQSVSAVTIEAYAAGLEGLTDDQVLRAGKRALQTSKFMPTPAEIRDLAGAGAAGRSIVAWGDVLRAIPRGPYRHIDFQDPIVNASIRLLGGWPSLFERIGLADGEKWYRIEFLKAYDSLCTSGVDGEICRPLSGISESEVRGGVIGPPVPLAIGCDPVRRKDSLAVVRGAIADQRTITQSSFPGLEIKRA